MAKVFAIPRLALYLRMLRQDPTNAELTNTLNYSFFQSPDGTEIWNVYHGTSNSGGTCSRSRYTMAQKVNWNADGTPNFGTPVARGVTLQGPSGE